MEIDFKSMKRKKLQSLCKKQGIPANSTNSKMAEALHSLYLTQLRPWADLPLEILELFLEKLCLGDHVRFGAVCKPWQSASRSKPHRIALKWPWLVLPQHPSHETLSMFSPMEDQIHNLNLSIPSGFECFGHSMGWLIMFDETEGYYLLNPLNNRILELPYPYGIESDNESDSDSDRNYNIFRRAILCDAPYTMVVAAQATVGGLYLCRPGDKEWVVLMEDFYGTFLFCKRYMYCLGLWEGRNSITCYEFDPEPQLFWTKTIELPEICIYNVTYLVESSSGDLLLVERMYDLVADGDGEDEKVQLVTTGFRVFKIDYATDKWVPIERLPHDDLIFVSAGGESCARASSSINPLGYKPNCIYFTDIRSGCLLYNDVSGSAQYYDQGMFSLEDGVIKQWVSREPYSPLNLPFWFFPKL